MWPTQVWWLPQYKDHITLPKSGTPHPPRNQMRLMACLLSGNTMKQEECHGQLSDCSWRPCEEVQRNSIPGISNNGRHCLQRKVNHPQPPVGTVLDLLSERFGQGLTYSAINCARSVLSSHVFSWTERTGLPRPRPPKPKYTEDCDVRVVLAYLATLHPVDSRHSKHFRSVETCYVAVISIRSTRPDYSSVRHIPYGCN